jgi:hypothetical protein
MASDGQMATLSSPPDHASNRGGRFAWLKQRATEHLKTPVGSLVEGGLCQPPVRACANVAVALPNIETAVDALTELTSTSPDVRDVGRLPAPDACVGRCAAPGPVGSNSSTPERLITADGTSPCLQAHSMARVSLSAPGLSPTSRPGCSSATTVNKVVSEVKLAYIGQPSNKFRTH